MPPASPGGPRRWLLLAALFLPSFPFLCAEEAELPWLVRVWKMGEELAGNNVAGVIESRDGFIWLVAGGKLTRFDGVSFRQFPIEAPDDPAGLRIREFTPLRDGGLAFALYNGALARVDGAGKFEVLNRELVDPEARVEALREDTDGSLLITCNNESVCRLRNGRLERFTDRDGLPAGLHCRFVPDQAGRLWFVKGFSVGLFRNGRFEVLQRLPGPNHRLALAQARRGGIWLGVGAQLFHCDDGKAPELIGELGLKNITARPTVLCEDRAGAVWFGTYDSGLFRFDGPRCESVPISHRQVVSLLEDREGSIWAGTSGGGLNQVQPRALSIEGSEAGLPSETAQAICEDTSGKLWAVTQDRLVVVRADRRWQPPEGLNLGNAACIAADAAGGVWIGSLTGQLHCWRDGHLTTWGPADGLNGLPVRLLVTTRSGDVWMGSSHPGMVQRLHRGRIETIELSPKPNLIRAIAEDAAGDVWIAGGAKEFWRMTRDGQIVDESRFIPSPPRQVRTLQATPDGSLWIGYNQDGIARIKDGRIGHIKTENGLLQDRIELLIPDGRGWLWIAGSQSIFKVSEQELGAVAEGRAQQVKAIRYGRDQGVRAVFGESVGALRCSDGRLWIPMATSLAIIDPRQSQQDAPAPPVVISEVRVDDRPVAAHRGFLPLAPGVAPETAGLGLPPGHRRFDLDFTALSLRTPSNVQFRYRLDGFDASWVEAGTRRSASYPQLPAGSYRFHVKACNSEGVWNETGATLAFSVAPFFWDTWWFRTAAVTGFTAVVFGLARYVSHRRLRLRLRAAEEETAVERERTRIARDIHDDLGSRLTKIVLLTGLVARDRVAPEKAGERIWEISETARQLLASLDETVWAVNPRNDTLPNLIAYLGEFTVDFLRSAEILCHVDLPGQPPPRAVPADVRHNLFLVVKEALNNVVRHAQATAAWLRITVDDQALTLLIEDNGRGFTEAPEKPEADGLRNMRARMTQVGGRFHIEGLPGGGTRVTLTFPWSARR